jgi:aminoglycoside phosphotransferase (APT) family kinase protein
MAKSPLILAALAKDAVPHVDFKQVNSLSSGAGGAFDTALLTALDDKHYIVRVANTQAAGTEQEVELRAFKALGPAQRSSLPFAVSTVVGETKDLKGHRALILEFVYGSPIDISSVAPDSEFSMSIGKAIAAIHNLDLAVVADAHLPEHDLAEVTRMRVAELDRMAATGKVPAVLLERWESTLEDSSVFRFTPTVIHGALSGDTVLGQDREVTGVLAWSGLKISDPAEDFAWIAESGNFELLDSVIKTYNAHRKGADATLRQRATLYKELEVGRWLLHGVSKSNQDIIDDAIGMLADLAEDVSTGVLGRLTAAAMVAPAAAVIEYSEITSEAGDASVLEVVEIDAVEEAYEIEASIETSIEASAEEFEVIDLSEPKASEPIDDKTRPIELPEKTDNELF